MKKYPKVRTVQDIQDVEGFWVTDSQEVDIINKGLRRKKDFDAYFVRSDSPDATAVVYGMYGIVSYLDKSLSGPYIYE